nr:hypothetical protein [Tanacetum cinerariifolium]
MGSGKAWGVVHKDGSSQYDNGAPENHDSLRRVYGIPYPDKEGLKELLKQLSFSDPIPDGNHKVTKVIVDGQIGHDTRYANERV